MTVIDLIAAYVADTPAGIATADDVEGVERSAYDTVGNILAGSRQHHAQALLGYLRFCGEDDAATVIGLGWRASPMDAAFVNGALGHALDFDDHGGFGHPSVAILPALLAIAERDGHSGDSLVDAFTIGYQVGTALMVGGYNQYDRGIHGTCMLGTVAATAAVSRLLRFGPGDVACAVGTAVTMAAGLHWNNGSMAKSLHAAMPASSAIESVALTPLGITGTADIFDRKGGFLDTVYGPGRHDEAAIEAVLAGPTRAGRQLRLKKYPSCFGGHSAVDALLTILNEHAVAFEDVVEVQVHDVSPISPVARYPDPVDGPQAKYSMRYAAAAALLDRGMAIEHLGDAAVNSARMAEAMAKVRISVIGQSSPKILHGDGKTNPVTVTLRDGTTFQRLVTRDEISGGAHNPLDEEVLAAKFRDNAGRALPRDEVEAASGRWRYLSRIDDVGDALRLLQGTTPPDL